MGRRYTGKTCRLLTMLSLTLAFFVVEIVVGYVTNSMALVADSFHMLSDVLALLIGFFSVRVARRRTTKNTFGWVRAEVLGALVNAVFLVALCFSILVEALKRLILVEPVNNPKLLLVVGAIGLLVNLIGLFLFHDHGHGHSHGHSTGHTESREHLGSFDKLNLSGTKYIEGAMADEDVGDVDNEEYTAVDGSSDSESSPGTQISSAGIQKAQARATGQTKLLKGNSHVIGNGTMASDAGKGGGSSDQFYLGRDPTNAPNTNTSTANDSGAHEIGKDGPARRLKPDDRQVFKSDSRSAATATPDKHKHAHSHDHGAHMSMRGVFLHVLGDALGSVVVVASALAIMYFKGTWRFYVDPCMSIVLVMIILGTTIPLLRESAFILLQTVPTHIEVEDLRRRLVDNIDGVVAVHEFHVWQLTGNRIIASAHIRCRNLMDYMKIAGKVKQFFHREGIHSTTIQPEFIEEFDEEERCLLQCRAPIVCAPKTCCGKNADKVGAGPENLVAGVNAGSSSQGNDPDAIDLESFVKLQSVHKSTRLPPPPGSASRKNRNLGAPDITSTGPDPKRSTNIPPLNSSSVADVNRDRLSTNRGSYKNLEGQFNPFLSQASIPSDTLSPKVIPTSSVSTEKGSSSTVITFLPSDEPFTLKTLKTPPPSTGLSFDPNA